MRPVGRWVVAVLLVAPLGLASAQMPSASAPMPDPSPNGPTLHPGDVVRVNVWRHPEMSGEFAVAMDSTLMHPLYQGVTVVGAPLPVVKERLRLLLANYEQDVRLVIEPLFLVTVAGEVREPNLYRLPQGTTFAQAIALAGGPTELGRLDKVRVIRGDSQIVLNLAGGYSRDQSLVVGSGDQILVARRSAFNLVRDVLVPVTSLTAAIAAILAYSSR